MDRAFEVLDIGGMSGSAFFRLPILGEDEVDDTGFFSLRVWATTAATFLEGAGMLVGAEGPELFVAVILVDSTAFGG